MRRARCHHKRKYVAKGLCGACYLRRWKRKHPERQRFLQRKWWLKKAYGLTLIQFDSLMVRQCGVCAICSRPMKRVNVDHDHRSLKVRGLLCSHCNHLAQEPEHLRAALRYMRYL